MILVAALDVAPAKSLPSRSTVRIPRNCASISQAAPVAPPPITHRSNWLPAMFFSSSALVFITPLSRSQRDLGPEPQDSRIRQQGIAAHVEVVLKGRL